MTDFEYSDYSGCLKWHLRKLSQLEEDCHIGSRKTPSCSRPTHLQSRILKLFLSLVFNLFPELPDSNATKEDKKT